MNSTRPLGSSLHNDAISLEDVTKGADNFGIDLTCASCACIFFTGYGGYGHDPKCKTKPAGAPPILSIQQAAKEVIDLQDACNGAGVAYTLTSRIIPAVMANMRKRGCSTSWANKHPIIYIALFKLLDLSDPEQAKFIEFSKPYEMVKRLAAGDKPDEVY